MRMVGEVEAIPYHPELDPLLTVSQSMQVSGVKRLAKSAGNRRAKTQPPQKVALRGVDFWETGCLEERALRRFWGAGSWALDRMENNRSCEEMQSPE